MRNWSVAGSIRRHFARSGTLIQPVYLREFVPEFQRTLSGHQACAGGDEVIYWLTATQQPLDSVSLDDERP